MSDEGPKCPGKPERFPGMRERWDRCCWCADLIDPSTPAHEPMAGYLMLAHTKNNHHRKCGAEMDQAFHERAVRQHLTQRGGRNDE